MAYTKNEKPSGLDTLTTLASDDLVIVADTSDSSRAKAITKANLATDLSAVDASETVKGVVEEATDAEVLAGTATGATGAKLFVTPAKLATNLPSMTGGNLMFSTTADENLTIGQPVGVSNNKIGYVAQANRTVATATTSFTAVNGFATSIDNCVQIGTDKFVFLDTQTADDTLYATVGTVTPGTKTVALGASAAVTADIQGIIYAICKLDTDRFIVFYQEDASNTIIKYRIGTVATSTITLGAAATFATATSAYAYLSCNTLSAEKGVMVYGCAIDADCKAIVFTTSGDVATAGTPIALGTNTSANERIMVRKIATDKFMLIGGTTEAGYGQVGTCNGTTTITLGSEAQFATAYEFYINCFGAVSPTTNTIIIRFLSSGTIVAAVAGTVSGTTITFGTVLNNIFTTGQGGIYADSTSSVLISGGGDTVNQGVIRLTLSGTTLSNQSFVIKPLHTSVRLVSIGTYFIGIYLYSTTLTLYIGGMSNGFIGIAQSTVSKGASVNVLYRGKDVNQNNLIAGGYYLASDGAFTLVASNVVVNTIDDTNIGKALSVNEILI